jgi:hypothetical protein
MDTRFWGPAGWKLLHHATFFYEPQQKHQYDTFLETIPYILPCKFCRTSLTDFYEQHPFKGSLESQAKLVKWMYVIHNCVNNKLRDQHLNPNPNPSLASITTMYHTWISEARPLHRLSTFWNFLFAVAYNHPKESSKKSKPMPDCPPQAHTCSDPCIRNKWNTLDPKTRQHWYEQFWDSLPAILGPELGPLWLRALDSTRKDVSCRKSCVAWLWRQRCALDPDFKDPYTSVCRTVASYSSECGAKKKAKTCRKTRSNK